MQAENQTSLLEYVNVLLRRWRLVVGIPITASVLAAVIALVLPPTYTARTEFVPELGSERVLPAGIAGLADQFGISLGGTASQGPQFYATVLTSREIMERVLLSRYPSPRRSSTASDSATLLSILQVDGRSLADSLDNAREALDALVTTTVDRRTNIVTLAVDSRYPALASTVANRFVQYLNEFNAETRQSQARERRGFAQERLADAERELRAAEDAQRTFLERNRAFQQSPQLVFEYDRLQRQMRLRQEVVLTLRREYETARIAEVNDTPVITVISSAVPPQKKSKPRRKRLVALGFVLGGVASVFMAFGAEFLEGARRNERVPYAEFRQLVARIRDELRRFLPKRARA